MAGITGSDILELDATSQTELVVPDIKSRQAVFAYRVIGTSMVHEDILPGDYVVVEAFDARSGEAPKIGGTNRGEICFVYLVSRTSRSNASR